MGVNVIDQLAYVATLISAVDEASKNFTDQVTLLVMAIENAVYGALAIYIVLWGWSMLRGVVTELMWDSVTRLVRISIVVGLALNTGLYATYISDFVWNAPDAMMEVITGMDTSMFLTMNQVISVAFKLGNTYWMDANAFSINGNNNLMLSALGAANWSSGVAIGVVVAGTLVVAKFALSILLGIGPLFIVFILFESTRRLFDAWLGQVIKYMVLIVLLSMAAQLVFKALLDALAIYFASYFANFMAKAVGLGSLLAPGPLQGLGVVSLYVICILVIQELKGLADTLGRGIAINLQTGMARR